MANYAAFTTTRTTVPDPVALRAAVQAATGDPTAVVYNLGDGWKAKKANPWSAGDLSATQTALDTTAEQTALQRYAITSRQKDTLATIALIVRAKGLAAWNGMTVPQKVAATLAEADVWTTIRDFIETNIP